MSPLISICMPTYNRAEYLSEAIEGILAQTHKNWELIVVDDGSTDSTPDLMEYYLKYPNIHYQRHIENQGIAKTRNDAVKLATGEYIAIHDSDDVSMRDRLKIALKVLKKTGADVFYSAYARADEHGRINDGIIPTDKLTAAEIRFNQGVPHATIVAKKECFTKVPYREYLKSNDDMGLIIDWYKAGFTWCMTKEPLYMVRYHESSTSATKDKEVKDFTKELLKELDGVE